jgi:hypothetical protein
LKKEFASALRASFAQLSSAESRVSHNCVCFGFLGLAMFLDVPRFSAFETLLFQL